MNYDQAWKLCQEEAERRASEALLSGEEKQEAVHKFTVEEYEKRIATTCLKY